MSSLFRPKLPLIRKVFRQGDSYTCSLCRTQHSTLGHATACLNQCWFDIHHFDPVVIRKKGRKEYSFRCHFCCRDYGSDWEARGCAQRCLKGLTNTHIREQLLNEEPIPAPISTVSKIRSQYLEFLQMQTHASAAQEAQKAGGEKRKQGHLESVEPVVTEEAKARGKHKSNFDKQWWRKGEKYVCNCCKVLHYTKTEAINCFEAHFDEEGYEKDA